MPKEGAFAAFEASMMAEASYSDLYAQATLFADSGVADTANFGVYGGDGGGTNDYGGNEDEDYDYS